MRHWLESEVHDQFTYCGFDSFASSSYLEYLFYEDICKQWMKMTGLITKTFPFVILSFFVTPTCLSIIYLMKQKRQLPLRGTKCFWLNSLFILHRNVRHVWIDCSSSIEEFLTSSAHTSALAEKISSNQFGDCKFKVLLYVMCYVKAEWHWLWNFNEFCFVSATVVDQKQRQSAQ